MARRTKKRLHRGTRINNKHNHNYQFNKLKVTQTGKRNVMTGGSEIKTIGLPSEQKKTVPMASPVNIAKGVFEEINMVNTMRQIEEAGFLNPKNTEFNIPKKTLGGGNELESSSESNESQLQTAKQEYQTAKGAHQTAKQKSMESLASLYGYGGSESNIYSEHSRMREPLYATVDMPNNTTPPNPIMESSKTSKPNTTPNYSLQLRRNISKMIEGSENPQRLQQIRKKLTSGNLLLQENKTYLTSMHPNLSQSVLNYGLSKSNISKPIGYFLNKPKNTGPVMSSNGNGNVLLPSDIKAINLLQYVNEPNKILTLNPKSISPTQLKYIPQIFTNYIKNQNLSNSQKANIGKYLNLTESLLQQYNKQKMQGAISNVSAMQKGVRAFQQKTPPVAPTVAAADNEE